MVFVAALILAIALHMMNSECVPLLIPESAEKYTIGIRCHY